MSVFGEYATFYDVLYQQKDYEAECDFIEQVFKKYAIHPIKSVLDLGCGTGGHSVPLAQRGYEVAGVDFSRKMLQQARRKCQEAGVAVAFHEGDIRHIELDNRPKGILRPKGFLTFDAVISMFAVISYQISHEDIIAAFRTANRHLKTHALFLFDVWFGPAVLIDPPTNRYKISQHHDERIIRFARPDIDLMRQTVMVNYKILRLRGDQLLSEVHEQHPMRFFFPQELIYLLELSGFEVLELCPFLTLGQKVDRRSWTISVVARKRGF